MCILTSLEETLKHKLIESISTQNDLDFQLTEEERKFRELATQLFSELQKIDGWKEMLNSDVFLSNNDRIFGSKIMYFGKKIYWTNSECDDFDKRILTINLEVPLKEQVETAIKLKNIEKEKIFERKKQEDLAIFEHIKNKYNL